jgi:hypothetical protein
VTAGQNFAGSQSGLITGQAAAQAAGQVGAANAYGGAVQGLGNQYYLSQLMKRPPGTAVTNYGGYSDYGGYSGVPQTSGVPGLGSAPGTGITIS